MQVDLAEFRTIFFEEAADHLEVLEEISRALVAAPGDIELINRMFRSVHSVKGAATSFGVEPVVEFTHHLEDCLERVRCGQVTPTLEIVELIVGALDLLQGVIEAAKSDQPAPAAAAELVELLRAATASAANATSLAVATETPLEVPFSADEDLLREFLDEAAEHLDTAEQVLLDVGEGVATEDAISTLYRAFHSIKGVAGFLSLDDIHAVTHAAETLFDRVRSGHLRVNAAVVDTVLVCIDALRRQMSLAEQWLRHRGSLTRDARLANVLQELSLVDAHQAEEELAAPSSEPVSAATASPASRHGAQENIKVGRERLDQLINVIGELVIAESMVQIEFADHELTSRSLPELRKIARELQDLSLSLRMVPVRGIFQKMSRVVRDVARKVGKRVTVRFEGEETELDKSMVDRIGDPLVHMVRNAVDHGIETPEQRTAADKNPEGLLVLRAYHKDGSVCIELEDDGRGLDRDAIRRKAIERGLLQPSDDLPDRDIYNLVFEPGFSTAESVTDISGRGVGMDVVRKNIESMQGFAQISSLPGEGATFSMWLPLTLAIVDGLLVRVSDNTYVLPISSVIESLRPARADIRRVAGRGELLVLRGESLPLVRLHELFNVTPHMTDPCDGLLVIINNRGKRMALFVDQLIAHQQVVMKSLEANYERVAGISGATILGDGSVALIVDTPALHRLAFSH
ncbi:MAG: chemotaxis protein CheA [Planctomycetota bacterium]|nr:chemotaxis protein CheA [Planctomycetota bacterium]